MPLLVEGFTLNEINALTTAQRSTSGVISQGRGRAKWFDLLPRVINLGDGLVITAKMGNIDVLRAVLAETYGSDKAITQHEYAPIDLAPGQTWNIEFRRGDVGTTTNTTNFHLHVYYENQYDVLSFRNLRKDKLNLFRQDLIFLIPAGNPFISPSQTVPNDQGYVDAIQIMINADVSDLTDTLITLNVNGVAVINNACAALFATQGAQNIVNRAGVKFPIKIKPDSQISITTNQLNGARAFGKLVAVALYFSGIDE